MLKPFENTKLFGYKEVEGEILKNFSAGKLHHALLITGQKGIGKATFAYRLANKILNEKETSDESASLFGEVGNDGSGNLDENNPTFKKIKSGSHPDFMRIEIKIDEKTKKPKTSIDVASVRKIKEFLNLTPSISKNRVIVIDSVDEMNIGAANAMLKILEEPPHNSYLLLVSHNPSQLLPTIRSRCNEVKIHPLSYEDWKNALRHALSSNRSYDLEKEDLPTLSKFSDNSVYTATEMLRNNGLEFYDEFISLIYSTNVKEVGEFAKNISGKNFPWWLFDFISNTFITRAIKFKTLGKLKQFFSGAEERTLKKFAELNSLDTMFEKYEKIKKDISTTARLNLNKKNVVIALIGLFGR